MKKYKKILVIAIVLTTIMTSCKDEGDSLVGTVWIHVANGTDVHPYSDTSKIIFKTKTSGTSGYSHYDPYFPEECYHKDPSTFTYTYDHPNGVMTFTNNGDTDQLTFTIEKNFMTVCYTDEYYPLIFHKQ